MKYLLFAGHNYYPMGGMDDLKGTFDTEQEAWNYLNGVTVANAGNYSDQINWFQVVAMNGDGLTEICNDRAYTATADGWVKNES